MPIPEYQKRAERKYAKTKCTSYTIKLVNSTDADIIEKLNTVPNRQGYIKALIRADLSK